MVPEELDEDLKAEAFVGNVLTQEEKGLRMLSYEKAKRVGVGDSDGGVDAILVPYLDVINSFPFIMTTQSCCGHSEKIKNGGRRAHIDFRSGLSEKETIDLLLRPMDEKYNLFWVDLALEGKMVRYVMSLDNVNWGFQLSYFIGLLFKVAGLKKVEENPWL